MRQLFGYLALACAAVQAFGPVPVRAEPFEEIAFSWRPDKGDARSYQMADPADQHRILLFSRVRSDRAYPVVVGFHGQPKPGKPPRSYKFQHRVRAALTQLYEEGETPPFVLVLPVFRFHGQNWPGFDPAEFRRVVEKKLAARGLRPEKWYAFGHSGAAGCGGDGMNLIHRMNPEKVGFFDTCLGKGWQRAIETLRRRGVETINIHSVETAGFRPRQRPEYQSTFDFGRAYAPLGLRPVSCRPPLPGRLRDQPYRCAATEDGTIKAFVVDTGEGIEAHEAVLTVAFRYFLGRILGGPDRRP